MYDGLSDAPHHGVRWEHAEAAVLVDEGYGRRGEEAEGAGDYCAHHQDHDAVELAELVPPQHRERNEGCNAVEKHRGDKTPHKHGDPVNKHKFLLQCLFCHLYLFMKSLK